MDTRLAIRSRRTVKDFTGAAIGRSTLLEMLDLAHQAPTHRLTQPWRFAVLDRSAIARLGEFLLATPAIAAVPDPHKGTAKLSKLLDKLPTLGALIQVAWERSADPAVDLEDHAAASAAVQNLLLAATALGLGSFWSTNPALSHPETQRWCGLDPTTFGFLGSIWLGIPAATPAPPPRVTLDQRIRFL